MTNDELKALIVESLEYCKDYMPHSSAKLREALALLESGRAFVGVWREDVENAPLGSMVMTDYGLARRVRAHLWSDGREGIPTPTLWIAQPVSPKVTP